MSDRIMFLPILVPTQQELPLLGMRQRPPPTWRQFAWQDFVWPQHLVERAFSRRDRFAKRGAPEHRAELLTHWGRRCQIWVPHPPRKPLAWCKGTSSDFRSLLSDAESILKTLLRRRRVLRHIHPRTVKTLVSTFDIHRWRVKATANQCEAFALLLCTMYWRGFREPRAVNRAPRHAPSGLVRWLSQFTVQQQVDHGRLILEALAVEEARVHGHAIQITARLFEARRSASPWVVVLPELLQANGRG